MSNTRTEKEYIKEAKTLKERMIQETTRNVKGTIKDLVVLLKAKEIGDYTEVFQTKLYRLHGGEYCHYLEFLA